MKITPFAFLRDEQGKLFLPLINILVVFLFVILDPFIKMEYLQLWMLAPGVLLLLNRKISNSQVQSIKNFLPLIFYVTFHFIITFTFQNFDFSTLQKYALFLFVYISFLILLSQGILLGKQIYLTRILNTFILIVGIYGIYQFIGRQLGLPFTLDEYLRFRPYKVAGFFQISSFFEEPAFFSQFLVVCLYIHLFFLDFKYKAIIGLLFVNIIFTISISGIVTFFVIFLIYLVSKVKFEVDRYISKKLFARLIISLTLLIVLLIVVANSSLPAYVQKRVGSTFVSDKEKRELEIQQQVIGGSFKYDRSGYLRVLLK